jgi:hypothetical protein
MDLETLLSAELQDHDGAVVRLAARLGAGPLVLVFLRHFG